MSDSEYSEHESENSFDKNKNNEIDNLDKLFKRMGLEHYRFEPTKKKKMKNHRKGAVRLKKTFKLERLEWCTCKNCRAVK